MSAPTSGPVVLVVRHEEHCGPGHVGRWLDDEGVRVVEVRPYAGEALPGRVDADGLVVCGGAMGANDDDRAPWLPATRALLRRAVDDGVPTLGLCLGGQLLAAACGGAVAPGAYGPEVGVLPFRLTGAAADDALLGAVPRSEPGATEVTALQWHVDEIAALPPDAVLLATGDPYRHQAFRVGRRAWGVQFHPEATVADVTAWADEDHALLAAEGRTPRDVVDELAAGGAALETLWRPVAVRFAALVREAQTATDAWEPSQDIASSAGMGRAT